MKKAGRMAAIFVAMPLIASAAGYYPNVAPSAWYVQPGQEMGFSGSGFMPGESVAISGSASGTVVADRNGDFDIPDAFAVPYNWQNTSPVFRFTGEESGASTQFTTKVGTYYPQVQPSGYWMPYGAPMSVSATGFAPGEQIELLVNGATVAQTAADQYGDASFNFNTPASGATFTCAAQGVSTGLSNSKTVYLY